jgi:hypothetical protein
LGGTVTGAGTFVGTEGAATALAAQTANARPDTLRLPQFVDFCPLDGGALALSEASAGSPSLASSVATRVRKACTYAHCAWIRTVLEREVDLANRTSGVKTNPATVLRG